MSDLPLSCQVELAGGKGVKVATILEDPVVKPGEMHIYATHTKHFPVRGSGFLAELDGASKPPTIVIDGISAANYKIQVCIYICVYACAEWSRGGGGVLWRSFCSRKGWWVER